MVRQSLLAATIALAACDAVLGLDGLRERSVANGAVSEAGAPSPEAGAQPPDDGGPDGSSSSITPVQAASTSRDKSIRSSITVSLDKPQLSGDLNVVVIGWYDTSGRVASVTDSSGNSYRLAVDRAVLPGGRPVIQQIFYASGIAAADARANVVSVAFSPSADSPDVRVLEYAGLDHDSPFDVGASNTGSDAPVTSGPVTTRFARELLIGAGTTWGAFGTPGTGFTVRLISEDANVVEDQTALALGSYAAVAPLSPPAEWVMQIATFH